MNFGKGSLPLIVILIIINQNIQISEGFKINYDQQKIAKAITTPTVSPTTYIKQLKCHVVRPGVHNDNKKNTIILDFMPSNIEKDLPLPPKCKSQPVLQTKMSGDLGIDIHDYLVLQGVDNDYTMECWMTLCSRDNKDLNHDINNTVNSPDVPHRRVARETRDLMTENEIEPFDQNEEAAYNLKASRFLPSYYPMQSLSGFTDKKGLNPLSLYLIRGKKGLFYVMPPIKTKKGIVDGDLSDKRAPPQGFWGSRGK